MKKKAKKIVNVDGEPAIKVTPSTVVYSILILLIAITLIGSILAYGTNTEIGGKIAAKISNVIPFPAAIISWKNIVYIDELDENLASVKQYYQTKSFSEEGLRVDFGTEDGKKRLQIKKREVLEKMIEDEIIMILAKEKGVKINDVEAEEALETTLNQYGTTDQVREDLLKSYGWDMEDFKKQVVLPNMHAQALAEKVLAEQTGNVLAREKIEKAQQELKNGTDFEVVVEKYSEGNSKEKKGELGWVKKNQVIEELAVAIFGNSSFQKNSIIESSIGFHIVEIEEQKKEDSEDVLKLRQIFVSKNTFADWLEIQKKKINVWIPMSEFVWNKENAKVKFRENEMNVFETEQRVKAEGDASLMF